VSAHYVVGKDGEVVKMVPLSEAAWHAGRSRHPVGGGAVNLRSVGIELVNRNDGKDPYPAAQIDALTELIGELRKALPIRYLYSHARVAVPKGRKTDPVGLDCPALAKQVGLAS
jgi:N-acetyl-anhydromuramyl-L-alanine amidase AmpD